MGQEGTRILAQSKGKGMNMTNEQLINEAISILQTMNMEDCAQAIDNLRHELERVKGIARDRLDKIVNLQQDVAVLEDKLEDTRSELRFTRESLNIKIGELLAHTDRLEKELEDTRSDVRYIREASGRAMTR